MGRDAEPVNLDLDDLTQFANALRIIAAMIDADVDSMRERQLSTVQPRMWRTATAAASDLSKFAGALRTAIAARSFPAIGPSEELGRHASEPLRDPS